MKVLRHLRVQTKMVAATLLAVVAALSLAGSMLYWWEVRDYRASVKRNLETLSKVMGANAVAAISFGDSAAATETLAALRAEPQIIAACIYVREGEPFAKFSRAGFQPVFPESPGKNGYAQMGDHLSYFGPIDDDRDLRRIGTIYLAAELSGIHQRLRAYAQLLGLVLAISFFVAFGLSAILQRGISGPIVNLVRTTKEVTSRRDYSLRVLQDGDDELGQLGRGFNEMLTQIESRDRALQQKNTELEAANKELDAFSSSISHDLRAPLRHIGGYVELVRKNAEDSLNEKTRRYLQIVTSTVGEMARLIDDLLEFSRMSRTEMKLVPVDFAALFKETLSGLEREIHDRNIMWEVDSLPIVQGDPTLLKQVLVNLISNAVKYTRQRDPAKIEVRVDKDPSKKEFTFFVRDNGAGFDMRYTDKLFGVFQRLHHANEFEGTGIGLATVRRILTRHHGRIWAEAAVDVGATFYFTLPCHPQR